MVKYNELRYHTVVTLEGKNDLFELFYRSKGENAIGATVKL